LDWEPDPVDLTADDLLNVDDNRPRITKVREPSKPERVAAAIRTAMQGKARPGTEVLAEVNEVLPFDVPATGWLVNRGRELAEVGTRWVDCEHGKFSEWYPLT
jgi:hypothetical protein